MNWTRRTKYFEIPGSLYPFDVRHDPTDVRFVEREADGRLRIRVHTEPALRDGVLVIDGDGTPLEAVGRTARFTYWEAFLEAGTTGVLEYTLAFKDTDGAPVYVGRPGVAGGIEGWEAGFRIDLAGQRAIETPSWARGAVIYQIFPDRFADGDPALTPPDSAPWGTRPHWQEFQGGDLPGVTDRLDYLERLGVEAIYLNPIFTSPSTHKYDASDYYSVDPSFGGDDALRDLVAAAHERDIRIILDVAFDHAHPRFAPFQDLLTNGPASEFASWFTVHDWPPRVVVREQAAREYYPPGYFDVMMETLRTSGLTIEEGVGEGPPVEPTYRAWYGVPTMPQLDLEDPGARAYFLDVATYWIREFDIDGWRMDVAREPSHDFWRAVRTAVRAERSDIYLLAEIWGDTSSWLQGDQFDATMNYTFRDLCVGYFAERRFDTDATLDGIHAMLAMYADAVLQVSHNLFSSHDVERFLHMANENVEALRLATFLQLTIPGAPGIYYGDEVAVGGGRDPLNRAAFPWERVDEGHDLTELLTSLTALRRRHPALRHGRFGEAARFDEGFAFTRELDDERILVVLNNSTRPLDYDVPDGATVLFGEAPLPPMTGLVAQLVEA
ncbi:MAG: glycoside hydrolase family 13 protein [Acidimicrobiia bacterium]|nr:glycoside hydrolase family 13 protein [Acidimicrobiia bacterium]